MTSLPVPAFAATSAEDCQAMFQKADVTKDGILQGDEPRIFLDAMQQAQVTPKTAGTVTQEEFTLACQKDAFANIDPAAIGTGPSGASASATQQPAAGGEAAPTTTMDSPSSTTATEQPAAGEATDTATTGATTATEMTAPATTATDSAATGATTGTETTAPATTATDTTTPTGTSATDPSSDSTTATDTAATTATTGTTGTDTAATDTATATIGTTSTDTAATDTTTATIETTATDAAADQPAEQALAIPEGLMVSDLIGSTIYSRDDEAIGEIKDMVLGSGSAREPQVVVGVGGFLGIGQKRVAVDLSKLQIATTEGGVKIVMDGTRADLENLAAVPAQ
jgi:hypothetical protein